MHQFGNVEPADINGYRLGNRVGRHLQLDRMAHDVQRAALLDAGADVLIDEMHRDGDAQRRTGLQPQEIDMQGPVGDPVELIVARDHPLLAALDIDLEDRRQKMPGVDELVDFAPFERNRLGGVAAAIYDGGNAALTANAAGGPLAAALRTVAASVFVSAIVVSLSEKRPSPPGVSETGRGGFLREGPGAGGAKPRPFSSRPRASPAPRRRRGFGRIIRPEMAWITALHLRFHRRPRSRARSPADRA